MKVQTGGDLSSGSKWVDEEGTFHCQITSTSEQPTKHDGTLIDNAMFAIALELLEGTNKTQIGKTLDIVFLHPKVTDKGEGAFAKKKVDRFLLAASLASQQQLEKADVEIDVDINSTVGRQIIVKIEMNEYEGKTRAQLSFAEIYHVDDPAMKTIPKSAANLRFLPQEERWIGNKLQAASQSKRDNPTVGAAGDSKTASDKWATASDKWAL